MFFLRTKASDHDRSERIPYYPQMAILDPNGSDGQPLVQFEQFKEVQRVLDNFLARPAVQRGLTIPS